MDDARVRADWYFDLISPFSYLQLKQFGELPKNVEITPKPILLGAILKHWGQLGPAEIAPKRIHTYRQCQWVADRRGIAFLMPERHPFNPLKALRLLIAAGATWKQIDAAFTFVFRDGRAPDTEENLADFARAIGVEGDWRAAADNAEAKAMLRANTEEAIARGVFGVPTFSAEGELFWGDDATGMFADWLKDRALFRSPAMRRIDEIGVGVKRER
jgi:2-hydroxychromene-2-carboxylate isomerase